ncbi:MAG: primary-amine oxidase [Acidimicrobiales bacterium]
MVQTSSSTGVSSPTGETHPLAPLTAGEIEAAVAMARAHPRFTDAARFAYIGLAWPTKDDVRAWVPGTPDTRTVRMMVVTGPDAHVLEMLATPATGALSVADAPGMRPGLLFEESITAILALQEDEAWQQAMRRRGIEDLNTVQIDPWPAGSFGVSHEEGRRICRCLCYVRERPDDNGYARPVEGVVAFVDMARGEVLEVVDTGVVPLPRQGGSYYPEDAGPLRQDLKPLEITQPEGPSFTVDGNLVHWQKWSLRVSMDPVEGLVLHQVGYEDGGRVRPVLFRASVSEMVVPYGDPGPMHGWKNAFDAGEWGLGRMANSLVLGCDCLGAIHYFDTVCATERGIPYVAKNVICMHEEDYGILWKHYDARSDRTEVRRSRRLVVSSIATVGNYDYGFFWYFYLDGTIQFEVKLTGILSTMAVADGEQPAYASMIAPQLAAPFHQHLFGLRLDVDVDGPTNSVYEVETHPAEPGTDNPWANAFAPVSTLLARESESGRVVDPATSRHWKIVNPQSRNQLGNPVAYKLLPGATPTLLARPESSVARRAGFATRNLWVTAYDPDERRAAGDYPNQHAGGDGLPTWTKRDRPIVERDIVVWYTFGVTHLPRPEDWPVMPVEYAGFSLVPTGFFDRNPALDVPPPPVADCHST